MRRGYPTHEAVRTRSRARISMIADRRSRDHRTRLSVIANVVTRERHPRRSWPLLRVRPAARAQWKRRQVHDVTEQQAHGSQPVRVRSGETPRSPVAEPPASIERSASKRGRASVRSATSREACSVVSGPGNRGKREPSRFVVGEGQGRRLGTWSGRRRTLRRKGAWNVHKGVVGTGEALLGPVCGDRSAAAYNRFGK